MRKLTELHIESIKNKDLNNLKGGWVWTCEEKRKGWKTATATSSFECSYTYMEWNLINDGLATVRIVML
jgi:hypothetical protein